MRVASFPGSDEGLHVLIHADNHRCEGDVHQDCDGVRSIEALDALLSHYLLDTLLDTQVLAQLQSLLYNYNTFTSNKLPSVGVMKKSWAKVQNAPIKAVLAI